MNDTATSSGLKSSSAAICARPCRLMSVQALADGTNAATVTLYDNASAASGTVLAKIVVDATLTYEAFTSDCGIEASNGIYAEISGTGAACVVHFAQL